jgi:drug/metabolite transporter (DMT)-like permease
VATINYLQIVTAFLWDFLFFNTKLKSTDIIGSVIIIFFIFVITIARAFGYIN